MRLVSVVPQDRSNNEILYSTQLPERGKMDPRADPDDRERKMRVIEVRSPGLYQLLEIYCFLPNPYVVIVIVDDRNGAK